MRNPKLLFGGLALAATMFVAMPGTARAGSLDLASSMTASCIGSDCSTVRFVLDIDTDIYVDIVRIFSLDGTQWVFDSSNPLVSVADKWGNPLAWTPVLENGYLTLKAFGGFAPEPIFITANMSTFSTPENLTGGNLVYTGQGNTQPDGQGSDVSYNGTVTPEPVSMVLLGTGLFGVAGAARRRRRKEEFDA